MITFARVFWVVSLLFVAAASSVHAECPFARMSVEVGMTRLEIESRVAALLGATNAYSPYGSNLAGGTISYHDASCELRVTFAPGAPAPTVAVAGGGAIHLAPKDETVLSHEIVPVAGSP